MNKLFIPISIIAAGLIIGGAVYLTDKSDNTGTQVAQNERPELELKPITDDDHILGNPDAEVVIVEYSDFECPFCGGFHGTMNRIMDEYGDSGDVAWVYRHMPLDRIHPRARPAAVASVCVSKLAGEDKFWDYADELFLDLDNLENDRLREIAISLGTDGEQFDECIDSDEAKQRVERDYQDGLIIAQADPNFGTPYNILTSKSGVQIPIVGNQPYAAVKAAIDAALTGEIN